MLYTAFGLHVVASGSIIHWDLKKDKGILQSVYVEVNIP